MFAGVGIIGALARILASLLVGSSSPADEPETTTAAPTFDGYEELEAIKDELAVVRRMLEGVGAPPD